MEPGPALFDRVRSASTDHVGKRYARILYSNYYGGSNYLEPDTGLIAIFRFRIENTSNSESLTISDTANISAYSYGVESNIYDYIPVFIEGTINIAACDRGDANLDEAINILDITLLIDWLYQGGWWPPDPICGDVNSDGTINILDITFLINYLYQDGPPPQ